MKTIQPIGGLAWLRTAEYYKTFHELVNQRFNQARTNIFKNKNLNKL
jgi:aspartate/glutamate racemase